MPSGSGRFRMSRAAKATGTHSPLPAGFGFERGGSAPRGDRRHPGMNRQARSEPGVSRALSPVGRVEGCPIVGRVAEGEAEVLQQVVELLGDQRADLA